MSAVLDVLLVGLLLHGALGEEFDVFLPKQIKALRGSCVTIPCFFQVRDKYIGNLNSDCKAKWRNTTNGLQEFTGQTGDLTQRECTTTLYDIDHKHNGDVFFRVECNNDLKWTFTNNSVNIQVKDAPPTLTLTPPTLNVREGESVTVQCSAPVLCLSLPPTLTWSPDLGDIQETLQETQDKTYVQVSTLSFTASHIHHEKNITCTAVYSRKSGPTLLDLREQLKAHVTYRPRNTRVTVSPPGPVTEHSNVTLKCSSDANPAVKLYLWYKADGGSYTLMGNSSVLNIKASKDTVIFCEAQNELGTDNSTVTQLNAQFAPQMKSSNCTGDSAQISCLCETEGNPIPIIQWHFSGLSAANQSISSEPLRSTITLVQPQWRDPVTLVCHSRNSLGSDSHRFNVSALEHVHGTSAEQQGLGVITPVFMASIATLVVLVFVLLCVIRTLTVRLNKQQPPAEAMEELPENADADDSGANSNKQSDVYSNVNWKTKSNKKKVQEAAGDTEPSCSSYLEEQRSIMGENRQVVIGKDVECEYAQVKFKPKRATNQ